jgi:hypothetical protein
LLLQPICGGSLQYPSFAVEKTAMAGAMELPSGCLINHGAAGMRADGPKTSKVLCGVAARLPADEKPHGCILFVVTHLEQLPRKVGFQQGHPLFCITIVERQAATVNGRVRSCKKVFLFICR